MHFVLILKFKSILQPLKKKDVAKQQQNILECSVLDAGHHRFQIRQGIGRPEKEKIELTCPAIKQNKRVYIFGKKLTLYTF